MQGDGNRFLVYFENEEHIVRRLGAAVINCWAHLDPRLQDRIIERAERVFDEEEVDDVEAEMKRFVLENRRLQALLWVRRLERTRRQSR